MLSARSAEVPRKHHKVDAIRNACRGDQKTLRPRVEQSPPERLSQGLAALRVDLLPFLCRKLSQIRTANRADQLRQVNDGAEPIADAND
jgi:hypothetical protein